MSVKHFPRQVEQWIEEALAERGVAYYANLQTGEINVSKMQQFFDKEAEIRREIVRKLNVYAAHATSIRKNNNMTPFSFAAETVCRVKQYAFAEWWQLPNFRGIKNTKPCPIETTHTLRKKSHVPKIQRVKKGVPKMAGLSLSESPPRIPGGQSSTTP